MYNENKTKNNYESDKFNMRFGFINNRVIKLTISNKVNNYKNKLTVVDSYPLLSKKLVILASDFGVETQKGIFPYKFVNKNTLFYKGVMPSIDYYNDISKEMYNSLFINK